MVRGVPFMCGKPRSTVFLVRSDYLITLNASATASLFTLSEERFGFV